MFCPNCGQERFSEATSFCSRCGYRLTETAELLKAGGTLDTARVQTDSATPSPGSSEVSTSSPRARGVKMGLFMMLLTVVLVPLLGILLTFGMGMRTPWPIGIVIFLLGGGGLLRIAYALMFEAGAGRPMLPAGGSQASDYRLPGSNPAASLPSQQTISAEEYVAPRTGRWRDTNELEPRSVTENTTRLLEKEDE